jgi:CHASE1-domain containing sensor protein
MKQEEKRERFKRLATQRTNAVLQKIKVLSNCANRSAYEYTEDEVTKIFSEIERHVKEAKAKFHFPKMKEFKL